MAAEVVFVDDDFVYRGPMQMPEHSAVLKPERRQEQYAIGCYTIARLSDGGVQSSYMDREQIQRCRKLSDMPNSLMWSPDKLWTEGWKKTAIRRAWKLLPLSPAMTAAQHQLDTYEGAILDQPERDITPPKEDPITPDQLASLRSMIENQFPDGTDVERWVDRLARRFDVSELKLLPAPQFGVAEALLRLSLKDPTATIKDAEKES